VAQCDWLAAMRPGKGIAAAHDLDLGVSKEGDDAGGQNRVRRHAYTVSRRKRREKRGI
jgi:hypothetical protein